MSLTFRGSRRTVRRFYTWLVVLTQIFSLLVQQTVVLANPIGGSVAAGSAAISSSGNTLTVTQTTNKAVINWDSFSIGQGEVTNFALPGSNASVLNRVTGSQTSMLLGTLQSNGNVFLINPNGIVIGAQGVINVNSFVGSTLNISDTQFLQGGDLDFQGTSKAGVNNLGTIRALEGDIYLVGATVENHGLMSAPNGTVGMAAGQDVRLVDAAHPHLMVRPTSQSIGGTGVYNTGMIEGMQAELMAAGGNIYALAINNEGTVRATGSAEVGGRVYLVSHGGTIASSGSLIAKKGSNGGDVVVHTGGTEGTSVVLSGLVDVSGDETGGTVFIKAENVNLTGANIDVSAPIPGDVFVTLGPHSVLPLLDPILSGGYINFTSPADQVSITSGGLVISTVGGSASLNGNGNTVTGDHADGFDGFTIMSSDPSNPYLQVVEFNADSAGIGNLDEDLSMITLAFEVREPDGTFTYPSTTLSLADFKTSFGVSNDTRIRIEATGGELIQKITITSVGFNNQGDPIAPMPVNSVKQFSGVTAAAPNVITVQKQVTPGSNATIFDFELRSNPSAALLYEFGLADYDLNILGYQEFSVVLGTGSYDITELVPAGWILTSIGSTIVDSNTMTAVNIDSTVSTNLGTGTATVGLATSETVTLIFNNTQGGILQVTKVTTGTDATLTQFDFVGSNGPTPISAFTLAGGASGTTMTGGTQSLTLLPGTYTIAELAEAGWFFDSITGGTPIPNTSSATVEVVAGQTAQLTFYNTQGGQLVINKNATGPAGPGTAFDFSATGGPSTVNNFTVNGGGSTTVSSVELAEYLRPGTYTIAELAEAGWFFDSITGGTPIPNTSSATVEVVAGQTAQLTFYNTQGGQLVINKNATGPAGPGTAFDFSATGGPSTVNNFTVNGGGSTTVSSVELAEYLRPGTYTIAELAEAGWFFDSISGGTPIPNTSSATVEVVAGQTAQLTFYNTQGGQLVINKNATGPAGPGTAFDFSATGGPSTVNNFTVNGGGSTTVSSVELAEYLRPGTYTIAELAEAGWFFDSITGGTPIPNTSSATVEVVAGQTAQLTFYNTQGGQLTVNKLPTGPDAATAQFVFDVTGTSQVDSFTLTGIDSQLVGSVELAGYLRPGEYTVTELATLGWNFDTVTGASSNIGPEAKVTVTSGGLATLTFFNTQEGAPNFTPPPFLFQWTPIYPSGLGNGQLFYGPTGGESEEEEIAGGTSADVFGESAAP